MYILHAVYKDGRTNTFSREVCDDIDQIIGHIADRCQGYWTEALPGVSVLDRYDPERYEHWPFYTNTRLFLKGYDGSVRIVDTFDSFDAQTLISELGAFGRVAYSLMEVQVWCQEHGWTRECASGDYCVLCDEARERAYHDAWQPGM